MSHVCDGRDPSCPGCGDVARGHELVRTAMTVDDELDDIKRARIWTQLEDKLVAAREPQRSRWPRAIGFAAAAMASAVAIAIVARAPDRATSNTLSVPAGTTVTSRLGPHTSAALVGPAQLDLVGSPGAATTIRLRSGMLLAEFAGGAGRSLRIEARGSVIDVVGTLFAVEIGDRLTCTSVARGRVRVTTTQATVYVGAGERYCTGGVIRPIATEVLDRLERHRAVITARAEPARPPEEASEAVATPAPPPEASEAVATPPPPSATPAAAPPPPSATPAVATPPPPSATPAAAPPPPSATPAVAVPPRPISRPAVAVPTPPSATPAVRGGRAIEPAPSRGAIEPPPGRAPPPPVAASGERAPIADPWTAAAPSAQAATARAPAPPPSADDLYRAAEAALAARDAAAADRALATLLADHPSSPLVEQALYERARIAYQQGSWAAARRHLDRLAAIPSTQLAEPGTYLACRIAVQTRDGEAATCLTAYRKRFPRSPHDLEALALLAQLAHAAGGCRQAAAAIDELVRSHPRTTLAAAWRARCPERP